jgi:lipopolysaccharide/colanic/teichoic acid biosynthesis glycosyltransferase
LREPDHATTIATRPATLSGGSELDAVERRFELAAKRLIDIVGAMGAIVALSPVLLWAAVAIGLTEGRPILFRQVRPGFRSKPFTLIKFRTMRPPRKGEVWYRTDAQRVTRIGRILRSTSIDELPTLWNVLRGEMSLVGPRPLFTEYLARYIGEEGRRHEVRPGITGWAVVNGRHSTGFEERLQQDVWYVDHWSVILDLRILVRTVAQVIRRTDVEATQDPKAIGWPDRFEAALNDASHRVEAQTAPD